MVCISFISAPHLSQRGADSSGTGNLDEQARQVLFARSTIRGPTHQRRGRFLLLRSSNDCARGCTAFADKIPDIEVVKARVGLDANEVHTLSARHTTELRVWLTRRHRRVVLVRHSPLPNRREHSLALSQRPTSAPMMWANVGCPAFMSSGSTSPV